MYSVFLTLAISKESTKLLVLCKDYVIFIKVFLYCTLLYVNNFKNSCEKYFI